MQPISPDCRAAVERFEDCKFELYWDAKGVASIGVGLALVGPDGHQIRRRFVGDPEADAAAHAAIKRRFGQHPITEAQADQALDEELQATANRIWPLLAAHGAAQGQWDAMVCLAYNIGSQGFAQSHVLSRHLAGVVVSASIDFEAAELASQTGTMPPAMEYAFGAWSHSGGKWLLGLFRRRMAEAMIYRGDGASKAIDAAWAIK